MRPTAAQEMPDLQMKKYVHAAQGLAEALSIERE
jgi:hypothetical protein